jgi:serine/threonine protein kinase
MDTCIDRYEISRREDGSLENFEQDQTTVSYHAVDVNLQRPTVIRVLRPECQDDEALRDRFYRETRATASVRDIRVPDVRRLGEVDGTCFCAHDVLDGESLQTRVERNGPLPVQEALMAALELAQVIESANGHHVVYGNLQPSDLLHDDRGKFKVASFELVPSHEAAKPSSDRNYTFTGNAQYSSPELLMDIPFDIRSNFYSIGAVMWFLLTGQPPFRGSNQQVIEGHCHVLPSYEELQNVPRPVVDLLTVLLQKEPAGRPSDPSAMIESVKHAISSVQLNSFNPSGLIHHPSTLVAVEPALKLSQVTAARELAAAKTNRRFALLEFVAGTLAAFLVYFLLNQPAMASLESTPPRSVSQPPIATSAAPQP